MASLYKRPDSDVWWMDYRDPTGKRHRETTRTTIKKDAELVMAQVMAGVKAQRKVGTKAGYGPTLKEAYKEAMREYKPWRDSTDQKTINANRKAVEGHFGEDTKLSAISRETIIGFVKAQREAGRAGSTINQRLSQLSVLFDEAVDNWGYGELVKPRMVREKVAEGRKRRFSLEEESQALELLEQDRSDYAHDIADLFRVLFDTGCRITEVLTITAQTYDLDKQLIILWHTKNKQPRGVPMTPRVHAILTARSHLEMPFGTLTYNIAYKAWARVRDTMGFAAGEEFVPHVVRHTAGSRLADAGVSGPLIQQMLGHKSIQTTQKYIHVSAAGLRGVADILAATSSVGGSQNRDQNRDQKEDSALVGGDEAVCQGVDLKGNLMATVGKRGTHNPPPKGHRRFESDPAHQNPQKNQEITPDSDAEDNH